MLRRLGAFFLDLLQTVVFAVSIFLYIYLLVLQPHKIKGASMEPNFPDGEFLLTDKITYRFNEPKRGDVIVFKAPATYEDEFIKRIIGLPGEQVSVNNGRVYINDELLDESYLDRQLITSSGNFLSEGKEIFVPQDKYLVFGDNRPYSYDSRALGFIDKDKITGRAWLIYWPLEKAGFVEKIVYSFE